MSSISRKALNTLQLALKLTFLSMAYVLKCESVSISEINGSGDTVCPRRLSEMIVFAVSSASARRFGAVTEIRNCLDVNFNSFRSPNPMMPSPASKFCFKNCPITVTFSSPRSSIRNPEARRVESVLKNIILQLSDFADSTHPSQFKIRCRKSTWEATTAMTGSM